MVLRSELNKKELNILNIDISSLKPNIIACETRNAKVSESFYRVNYYSALAGVYKILMKLCSDYNAECLLNEESLKSHKSLIF
jgi:hypothetical protein